VKTRPLGRLGSVSEIGYGMWAVGGGEGGWTGTDEQRSFEALCEAVDHGCNFFDTAWIYGRGRSEQILGDLLRRYPDRRLYVATKIPPRDRQWPSTRASTLEAVFPEDHVRQYLELSARNLGVDTIDLLQFHVWEDAWASDARWQDLVSDLKDRDLVRAIGISINRWEPWNVMDTLRTGLIDVVQTCYNIFDQSPEDELFPFCQEKGIGVIARVPFDEGALTGTLTRDSRWPDGDWRNSYFVPENLIPTLERVARLERIVPDGDTLASLALQFILQHPGVSTVIPGMRTVEHVRQNLRVSVRPSLSAALMDELRKHRWDREPTWWSQ
jgi:aryl-alcohol dehydrogenase-like predicted oxidoreductase